MGKGSSKAGGTGTASNGIPMGNSTLPPVTTQVTPPTPAQVARGDIVPGGGVPFKQFESMTDDQKADVIDKALGVGLPMFLDDSGLQRFAYFTGMSDKPKIVSDSALDSIQGKDLYRTVHDSYNRSTDIGYTAHDICEQITKGDFTMYSDSGGSAYGKAIYFADNFGESKLYGSGQPGKDLMIRAKITGKIANQSTVASQYRNALNSGDKLAQACAKSGNATNLYALAKGYDAVYDTYSGYHMILNRRAITVSDTYKDPNGRRKW